MDHAGAFGHAANGHSPAVDPRASHHRFRFEIGREDGTGCLSTATAAELVEERRQRLHDTVDR
jgi:hypothetical protein